MSRSTKDVYADFCAITGSSIRDAKRYIDRYKRLDAAVDVFFQDNGNGPRTTQSSTRLTSLFEKYRAIAPPAPDPDSDFISTHGTVQFLADLGFKQPDEQLDDDDDDTPKFLLLAYELQSPRLAVWPRRGWLDGWRNIGCDSIDAMKSALTRLEHKLASDPSYFRTVYNFTFNFARSDGQRSLAKDTALDYWKPLLHFAVGKDALKHIPSDDEDVDMDRPQGWTRIHTNMWLEYMQARDDIAVSKDTWQMLPDFIRSFDGDFNEHDDQAAWPTIIDHFVEWAKKRV